MRWWDDKMMRWWDEMMRRMTDHFFRWRTQHHFHFMRDHPAHFIEVSDKRKQSINQYLILDFTHTCYWNGYVVVWSQWTIPTRPSCSLYWGADQRKRETVIGVYKGDKNLLTNIIINISSSVRLVRLQGGQKPFG